MIEIKTNTIQPNIRELFSFATSEKNIEREYALYTQSLARKLYGYECENDVVGCIGIEIIEPTCCEIKHIAVHPSFRGEGIGSKMIGYIQDQYSVSFISAETDQEAVGFYKKMGFNIISLGEKYPNVERFRCTLESK